MLHHPAHGLPQFLSEWVAGAEVTHETLQWPPFSSDGIADDFAKGSAANGVDHGFDFGGGHFISAITQPDGFVNKSLTYETDWLRCPSEC